jgi:hypothetical protein
VVQDKIILAQHYDRGMEFTPLTGALCRPVLLESGMEYIPLGEFYVFYQDEDDDDRGLMHFRTLEEAISWRNQQRNNGNGMTFRIIKGIEIT